MPVTTTINREEREALFEQVRNHLAALRDVWLAMEQHHDYETAERLGIEFSEDFRLLHDLGWHPTDGRQLFELTMPAEDLTEVLARLHSEAVGGLWSVESEPDDRAFVRDLELARDVSASVIRKITQGESQE